MTSSTLFACAKMLGKIKVWLRLRRATLCVVVLHFACSSHTLFFLQLSSSLAHWRPMMMMMGRGRSVSGLAVCGALADWWRNILFFLCVILRVSSFNSRFSAVLSCGRLFFSSSYSSIHFFLRFISTSTPTLSPRRRRRLLMKIQ